MFHQQQHSFIIYAYNLLYSSYVSAPLSR